VSLVQQLRGCVRSCDWEACSSKSVFSRMWRGERRDWQIDHNRYCSERCFEQAMHKEIARLLHAPAAKAAAVRHRVPLGLILLSRGVLSEGQLRDVLAAKVETAHGRFGELAVQLGFATEQDVITALGAQWGTPVLSAETCCSARLPWLPLRLLERHRALPVHLSRERQLYVAFADGISHELLRAIERIEGCTTNACLVGGSVWKHALLDWERERVTDSEVVFEVPQPGAAIAGTICSYVHQWRASRVRLAKCGEYMWARLDRPSATFTLLMRHSEPERERRRLDAQLRGS